MKILHLKKVIGLQAAGISLIILICLSAGICIAQDADSDGQEPILVIGTGAIIKGNTAAARNSAISDALVKGLEEYLTRHLGSQGMMDNFSRIIDEILPEAKEKTDNYYILAEDQTPSEYKILVRVKLNEKMIDEKLKEMDLILMQGTGIKVLFMVSQENAANGNILFWWGNPDFNAGLTETELALYRVFEERGYVPVNRVSNFPEESYTPEMRDIALNDEEIIKWGRLFSADVVISGECEILDNKSLYVHLKSYSTETGNLIYSGSRTSAIETKPGVANNLMEALVDTVEVIASELGPETIKAVESTEGGVSKIAVELSGLRSIEQFRRFRSFLIEEIQGVESVVQSRIKPNSITVEVHYRGRKESFIEQIKNRNNFPFLADISSPEEGKVLIELK